ncbi:MAG: hypothetical protein HYZ57_21445 [Acidobacteria bacterium]|nr:hypothetical protein [Acidobacteriota bacterium]
MTERVQDFVSSVIIAGFIVVSAIAFVPLASAKASAIVSTVAAGLAATHIR